MGLLMELGMTCMQSGKITRLTRAECRTLQYRYEERLVERHTVQSLRLE